MKGFKPTGHGPSAGFKYPAHMGFTGSTGSVTNVASYTRRKAFANGGYVRKEVGDVGSSMVRRAKPSTAADAESGGKSPLRPGFANGGRMGRMIGRVMQNANTQSGAAPAPSPKAALVRQAKMANAGPRQYTGGGALGRALSMIARQQQERDMAEDRRIPTPGVKGRFYEKGGKVLRRPKEKQYTFMESVRSIPRVPGALADYVTDRIKGKMYSGERTVEGRNESIDERVTRTQRYSRGGKAKRMGYADGGGVSAVQAKRIAERTVGEHVRYPAPKGHKGQRACKANGGAISDADRRYLLAKAPSLGDKPERHKQSGATPRSVGRGPRYPYALSDADRRYLRAKVPALSDTPRQIRQKWH